MPKQDFDIAIIGGGVIGRTLARALVPSGASIAVFDAGDDATAMRHPPASAAAAGMLAPSFECTGDENSNHAIDSTGAFDEALYGFSSHSLTLWSDYAPALQEETGVFIDYRDHGALGVAFTEPELAGLARQADLVARRGGAAEMISGDEARQIEPALSESFIGALWAHKDAQVDPRRLLTALGIALDKTGVRQVAARIVRLKDENQRTVLVSAAGETFSAAKLVFAGGALRGPTLGEGAGRHIFPVKGEAVALLLGEGVLTRVVRAPGAYLCPKAEGRLVIGASEAPGRDDSSVDASAIEALIDSGVAALPALAGKSELERWAGLRPGTPDGGPILGQDMAAPEGGRFLALGHYRNGILLAPATAIAMADVILGRAPAFDIAPFSPGRFGN